MYLIEQKQHKSDFIPNFTSRMVYAKRLSQNPATQLPMKKIALLFTILFFPAIIYVVYVLFAQNKYKKIPYFGARQAITSLIDGKTQTDTNYHTTANFEVKNQNNQTINPQFLDGKIYVVTFFDTKNMGLATTMLRELRRVANNFESNKAVVTVSFCTNPSQDSIALLANIAKKFEMRNDKSFLVNGLSTKQMIDLATKSYLLKNKFGNDDTTRFESTKAVVVDYNRHIRGFFEISNRREVEEMMGVIRALKIEYATNNPLLPRRQL